MHIWKGNLQIYSFSSTLTGTALTTVLPFVVRKLNLWLHNLFLNVEDKAIKHDAVNIILLVLSVCMLSSLKFNQIELQE